MEKLLFKLEVYEGPLDLLLDMIKNSKVNILDINISEILDQYLLYLKKMEQMNLELTADFLAMASHLLLIKSKMLLPKPELETDDPRKVLIDSLLEYQKCKQNAQVLLKLWTSNKDTYTKKPMEMEIKKTYRDTMPISYLVRAYSNVLEQNRRRLPPKVNSFVKIVGEEPFSVGKKMSQLLKWFRNSRILDFRFLFSNIKSRSEAVATFLAVLEMAKTKRISIIDDEDLNYRIEFKK